MSVKRKFTRKIFLLSGWSVFLFWCFFMVSMLSTSASALAEADDNGELLNAGVVTKVQNIVPDIAAPVIAPAVVQPVQAVPSSLPWYVTRAAAITAYLLLFLMIVMGEGMASGVVYTYITPMHAWITHKYLGISFGIALLMHMVSLLFDKFVSFGIWDVFIPFHASYRTFFVALGTIGFYLTLIILLSSLIGRFQHSSWWRKLHFLVYPLFIVGLVHGLFTGTDSGNVFMLLLYSFTGIVFCLLMIHRGRLSFSRR